MVCGCGACERRNSGERGGRTKDVGRSDVATVEGMTSVSKDASMRLFVIKRLGWGLQGPRRDLRTGFIFTFTFDLERVFWGEAGWTMFPFDCRRRRRRKDMSFWLSDGK